MTANNLTLPWNILAKLIHTASMNCGRPPKKEAEEFTPWWACPRPANDPVEKITAIQSIHLMTSAMKKIG